MTKKTTFAGMLAATAMLLTGFTAQADRGAANDSQEKTWAHPKKGKRAIRSKRMIKRIKSNPKLMAKIDLNGDGVLSQPELRAAKKNRRKKMLATYDVNADGKLGPAERQAMRRARIDKRFSKLDVNGDGVITKLEFSTAKNKRHHRRGRGKHKNGNRHKNRKG